MHVHKQIFGCRVAKIGGEFMDEFCIRISSLKKNQKLKVIKKLLILSLIIYTLACLFIYFFLEKLILWPQKLSSEATVLAMQKDNIEDIELKMKDGNTLRGWFVKNSNSEKSNLLIYFGGNAEELSNVIPKMSKLNQWSVALINYRGYGMSEGTSIETTLYSDSTEIYDYFASREDVNTSNIVVMGRSIGTGVATYLAASRNTSAVILSTPYDSLVSVVQKKLPILPVDLILPHKYDSIGRANSIKIPLLIIAGTEDKIIPTWHSRRLKETWGGKVFYEEISGEDHNSIDDTEEYWNKIREFLLVQDSI